MTSVGDDKRRLVPVFQQSHELRLALFEELAGRRTYRNAIGSLERLWKRATQGQIDNRLFFELAELAHNTDSDDLTGYVEELRRVVIRDFRLAEPSDSGEPAAWACNYLHCAVEPRSGQGEPDHSVPHVLPSPRPVWAWTEEATMKLKVSPIEASGRVLGDDGSLVGEFAFSTPKGFGPGEWDRFGAKAHAMLDKHLQHMRDSYEKNNAGLNDFQFRNPTRRRREHDDMVILVEWLLGNKAPGRTTGERLRKRAEIIGIAFPPPSR